MENLSHPFLLRCYALLPPNRKIFIAFWMLALLHQVAVAQNPFKFSYQGIARDGNGKLVNTATVSVRVKIHEDSPAGPVIYEQTSSPQTNTGGVFNLVVGTNAFLNIDWGSKDYFMQTEIDADGGADSFTDIGTTPLLSVPYSLISKQWVNNYPIVQKGNVGSGPNLSNVQAGANLIWYPKKGAFRAGSLDMNGVAYWDHNGIGLNSFATGFNTKASGEGAIAMGKQSYASGSNSITIGSGLFSNADNAVAIGYASEATEEGAVAIGSEVHATGIKSFALGSSVATASGAQSVSIGAGTVAKSFGGIAVGAFNNQQDPTVAFNPLNRIFQIGNGVSDNNRSNALTVLRNGNVGIGNNVTTPDYLLDVGGRMRLRYSGGQTPGIWLNNANNVPTFFMGAMDNGAAGFYTADAGWFFIVYKGGGVRIQHSIECYGGLEVSKDLKVHGDLYLYGKTHQYSDKRLKSNIIPVSNSLSRISGLRGYTYQWKDKTKDPTLQTGVIAQEVEAIFPELVTTDKDGLKSVNYVGLIPHLIEAVKELRKKDEAVDRLEKEMETMKRMIAGLKDSSNDTKNAASASR